MMDFAVNDLSVEDALVDIPDLNGTDIPEPSAYLSARQRDGQPLGADVIYRETMRWLKDRGCDRRGQN